MSEPGRTVGMIGAGITLLGALLILGSLNAYSGLSSLPKAYRPGLWRRNRPARQIWNRLRGLEPVPAAEVALLQAAARVFVRQRWLLLLCLGSVIAQLGGSLGHSRSLLWLLWVGGFTVFMAVTAVLIERQARVGTAFLRRFPPPEPHGPAGYPGPAQPGSV